MAVCVVVAKGFGFHLLVLLRDFGLPLSEDRWLRDLVFIC